MSAAHLRPAEPGDAKILAYIQTESWKAAFAGILSQEELTKRTEPERVKAMYERILSNPAVHLTIETVEGTPHCIAGWSRSRGGQGENTAELICIHSLPDRWRRGYGSMMMDHVLSEIREQGYEEVVLWVFEQNHRARRFYEKHGFTLTDQTQNSFGPVERMYIKNFDLCRKKKE